ncbi:hypothetical protein CCAX7_35640 [Capsulimonas corticalis]|uniref:Uncharacterized protein n=1 Tax=Capsulimonas corticalis TaxID=2219043 RepID=A0A402D637_9BACT|nr:hypothetical protein [Capsulimonas corticalis]BDI31513.1 hypothetical protein CCAX7_35640 [Capsulimonas corticalis]
MSLLINAPAVEQRLAQEAQRHGVPAEDYAVHILSTHLEPLNGAVALLQPYHATATAEEWTQKFDEWVEGHPQHEALPEGAFDRASFYEGRS